jgi:hypothetical protein
VSRESAIQAAIVELLTIHGFRVIRINSGLARGLHGDGAVQLAPAGTPDLVALPPAGAASPLPWWLEVKTSTGRVRKGQAEMHQELRERGQIVRVVRSVDDVLRMLRGAGLSREHE